jgi:sec-independent protein translocase protein TatA
MDLFAPSHIIVLGLLILLFFGNRLPSVMRSLGQGVVEFKKGLAGIENDVKNPTTKIEEQPSQPQNETKPATTESAPH